jgi:pimeloyl-ACP methyl ester carboxylesterase
MDSGAASEGAPQSSFDRDLADRRTGVAIDLEPDSKTMVIAFGGLIGRLGIFPFEFFQSVSAFGVKKMFVRDRYGCWYQRGVEDAGADVESVSDTLARVIAESGVERTVAVGNSAGGYAALLFGHLLDFDEVHAFVPQTLVDPEVRRAFGDERWPRETVRMHQPGWLDARYADLRPVLMDSDRPRKGSFHVYYSRHSPLDEIHARNLVDVDGVILHGLEQRGHAVVRKMRDSGALRDLLERALLT